MKREEYKATTLGEIVSKDIRTAEVFREAGLDFCCGGKLTLSAACQQEDILLDPIIAQIERLAKVELQQEVRFDIKPLDDLIDYIVNTHHSYIRKSVPELSFYTSKIANVHGENHPELKNVAELFDKLGKELLHHIVSEEEDLFPAIKRSLANKKEGDASIIDFHIIQMENEHEAAGCIMHEINKITNAYRVPSDGCNTYAVTFNMLEQFEKDLHLHVHLENNILFPRVLSLLLLLDEV